VPVIAVKWWGAGEGSGKRAQPHPQEKKLYKGSVVRVSASYSSDFTVYSWIAEINMTPTQRIALQC